MSIASRLLEVDSVKNDIKAAIEAKGVSLAAVPFTGYAAKIGDISGGTGPEPVPDWVRPADWLAMPAFSAGEQKVCILMAVFDNPTNAVAFYNSGATTVDWGDGTVTNYASNTQAEKLYDYASINNNTLSTRGYKQVLITITPQAGQNLLGLNLRQVHSTIKSGSNPVPRNYLDVIISAPNCTSLVLGDNSSNYYAAPYCERVEIKEIGNITSTVGWCAFHYSLQEFSMPAKASVTNTTNMFTECRLLREVSSAVFSGATSTTSMFQNCSNLVKVTGDFSASTNLN